MLSCDGSGLIDLVCQSIQCLVSVKTPPRQQLHPQCPLPSEMVAARDCKRPRKQRSLVAFQHLVYSIRDVVAPSAQVRVGVALVGLLRLLLLRCAVRRRGAGSLLGPLAGLCSLDLGQSFCFAAVCCGHRLEIEGDADGELRAQARLDGLQLPRVCGVAGVNAQRGLGSRSRPAANDASIIGSGLPLPVQSLHSLLRNKALDCVTVVCCNSQ